MQGIVMGESTYKVIDLFGNEETRIVEIKKSQPNLFHKYDDFVDKFKAKKTTDDCFTPPDVFDLVLNYVRENCDIDGIEIMRPFYPGGDYERIDYPENCVVIDNPPFSIISKIARFYIKRGIKFFLFAPHLTLFSAGLDCTHIVVGGNIEYENGAKVKTSFLSNLFGDIKVIGDAGLFQRFKVLEDSKRESLPKYVYPDNVLTVSQVSYIIEKGISLVVNNESASHCRQLDDQKRHKKTIFGSGFLLSEKAAAEKAAAEKENVIEWKLSDKEINIIKKLL